MSKLQEGAFLEIHWVDSCHENGWKEEFDVKDSDMKCVTVGMFYKETPLSISVIQSKNDGEADSLIQIPKCAIQMVRRLVHDGKAIVIK